MSIIVLMGIPLYVFIFFHAFGIVLTISGSLKPGFYRFVTYTTLHRGDYVSFCLPDTVAQFGESRGYIGKGDCENGSQELLKKVIALPRDHVELTTQVIRVNGISYRAPEQHYDGRSRKLKRWVAHGAHHATGIWVYGANSPDRSWDSRYYGEIPLSNITHKLQPLWIF